MHRQWREAAEVMMTSIDLVMLLLEDDVTVSWCRLAESPERYVDRGVCSWESARVKLLNECAVERLGSVILGVLVS